MYSQELAAIYNSCGLSDSLQRVCSGSLGRVVPTTDTTTVVCCVRYGTWLLRYNEVRILCRTGGFAADRFFVAVLGPAVMLRVVGYREQHFFFFPTHARKSTAI